jgi:predicted metal-dependent hydrolase
MPVNAAILLFCLERMRCYFRNANNSNECKMYVEDRVNNVQENQRKMCKQLLSSWEICFFMLHEPINVR